MFDNNKEKQQFSIFSNEKEQFQSFNKEKEQFLVVEQGK